MSSYYRRPQCNISLSAINHHEYTSGLRVHLYRSAPHFTTAHNELLPPLPEDEMFKQKEWFPGIMKYSNPFEKDVKQWILEIEQSHSVQQKQQDSIEIKESTPSSGKINEHSLNIFYGMGWHQAKWGCLWCWKPQNLLVWREEEEGSFHWSVPFMFLWVCWALWPP